MKWLKNRLINRSVLAPMIWKDKTSRNTLRKRLEQKVLFNTLTDLEKQKIVLILRKYINFVKKSLKK